MSKEELFLGIRKSNGQIGYLSEGIKIPDFFNLIQKDNQKDFLIDFAPIIEELHSIHQKQIDKNILEQYNSVYNYWQESASYSKIEIKIPKFESLSKSSNELIAKLNSRINQHLKDFQSTRFRQEDKKYDIVKLLEKDCNIYIDILLCFIHSKASLEIESFKNDKILDSYCRDTLKIIKDLYFDVVGYSTYSKDLNDNSLLYYFAFTKDNELKSYINLIPFPEDTQDLRLILLDKAYPTSTYNNFNEPITKIEIEYSNPNHKVLEMAKILRNLYYKFLSLSELLKNLKENNVEWSNDSSLNEKLIEYMKK